MRGMRSQGQTSANIPHLQDYYSKSSLSHCRGKFTFTIRRRRHAYAYHYMNKYARIDVGMCVRSLRVCCEPHRPNEPPVARSNELPKALGSKHKHLSNPYSIIYWDCFHLNNSTRFSDFASSGFCEPGMAPGSTALRSSTCGHEGQKLNR